MRLEYFQLIDRIVDLDLTKNTICTEARIPTASTVFEGHFPGHPIMPGVLLIEAMAQTGGWLTLAITRMARMPFLAAVKEAKMRTFVSPGRLLKITAQLVHEGSGYAVTRAKIEDEGKAVCDSEIMLRLMDFPNAQIRAYMEEYAKRLEFPLGALADG
jgi:3-hydroxyacyl-[acyl-carrier-protein] dehydratase